MLDAGLPNIGRSKPLGLEGFRVHEKAVEKTVTCSAMFSHRILALSPPYQERGTEASRLLDNLWSISTH